MDNPYCSCKLTRGAPQVATAIEPLFPNPATKHVAPPNPATGPTDPPGSGGGGGGGFVLVHCALTRAACAAPAEEARPAAAEAPGAVAASGPPVPIQQQQMTIQPRRLATRRAGRSADEGARLVAWEWSNRVAMDVVTDIAQSSPGS